MDLYCADLPTRPAPELGTVLVTGGTAYIGGRQIPELQAGGYAVRVMFRRGSSEHAVRWPGADIVVADALDAPSLQSAMGGVRTAYYLIHSRLLGNSQFEFMDIRAAASFREAAVACVSRKCKWPSWKASRPASWLR
jgi:uncharacterized protein YbjT (DUF2867 family)